MRLTQAQRKQRTRSELVATAHRLPRARIPRRVARRDRRARRLLEGAPSTRTSPARTSSSSPSWMPSSSAARARCWPTCCSTRSGSRTATAPSPARWSPRTRASPGGRRSCSSSGRTRPAARRFARPSPSGASGSSTSIAGLIEELGARHGVRFAIPAKEIARGSNALARGIALDRLLDRRPSPRDLFEEMHTAYVLGLTRPSDTERGRSMSTTARRRRTTPTWRRSQAQGAELIARDGWSRDSSSTSSGAPARAARRRGRRARPTTARCSAPRPAREVRSRSCRRSRRRRSSTSSTGSSPTRGCSWPSSRSTSQGPDPGALYLGPVPRLLHVRDERPPRADRLQRGGVPVLGRGLAAIVRAHRRSRRGRVSSPIGAPNPLHITRQLFAAFGSGRAGRPSSPC